MLNGIVHIGNRVSFQRIGAVALLRAICHATGIGNKRIDPLCFPSPLPRFLSKVSPSLRYAPLSLIITYLYIYICPNAPPLTLSSVYFEVHLIWSPRPYYYSIDISHHIQPSPPPRISLLLRSYLHRGFASDPAFA